MDRARKRGPVCVCVLCSYDNVSTSSSCCLSSEGHCSRIHTRSAETLIVPACCSGVQWAGALQDRAIEDGRLLQDRPEHTAVAVLAVQGIPIFDGCGEAIVACSMHD
jgi:hypothetical protein